MKTVFFLVLSVFLVNSAKADDYIKADDAISISGQERTRAEFWSIKSQLKAAEKTLEKEKMEADIAIQYLRSHNEFMIQISENKGNAAMSAAGFAAVVFGLAKPSPVGRTLAAAGTIATAYGTYNVLKTDESIEDIINQINSAISQHNLKQWIQNKNDKIKSLQANIASLEAQLEFKSQQIQANQQ